MAHSATFILLPKTTCPGVMLPTVGWALSNHQSRKWSTELPTVQSDGNIFPTEILLSQMTLACVEMTEPNINNNSAAPTTAHGVIQNNILFAVRQQKKMKKSLLLEEESLEQGPAGCCCWGSFLPPSPLKYS